MKIRWPMHLQLSTLFVSIFLIVCVIAAVQRMRSTEAMIEASAGSLIAAATREASLHLERVIETAEMATSTLSRTTLTDEEFDFQRRAYLPLLAQALKSSEHLAAVYVGYESGDMFLLRRLQGPADEQAFRAPAGTRYLLQSLDKGRRGDLSRYAYLDEQLRVLLEQDRPEFAASYDPRQRTWFQAAMASDETVIGEPYLFFTTGRPGMTVSSPSENARAVVGADIEMSAVGALLRRIRITPAAELALVTPDGRMYAHAESARTFKTDGGRTSLRTLGETGIPVLEALYSTVQSLHKTQSLNATREVQGREWRVSIRPLRLDERFPVQLVMAVPSEELLAAAYAERDQALIFGLLIALACVAAVTWAARRVSVPLQALAVQAGKVQRFDFGETMPLSSRITEVDELARAMDGMRSTIRRFLTITGAVSSEENFERLLPLVLTETLAAAGATAGVLYLDDQARLRPGAAKLPGRADAALQLPLLEDGHWGTLLAEALQAGQPRQAALDDAQLTALGILSGDERGEERAALRHGLAVPLLNRRRERVGCLLLLRGTPFELAQAAFIKALSSSAASSLEARELIDAQRQLFEAFIRLIAGAIDAKSPYTGGHCERVPELTKMLARAACEQTSGPFADFQLAEQEWEAVHVASWLHDCGKITTPEFVVDKATKLETLHDRIHEVRTRFEVLKRDAEIACWKAVATGMSEQEARARLAAELAQLDDDYAFVAACNEGGEAMSREDQDRLRVIGARTWLRTLDDRIGISHEEGQRKAATPAVPLPAVEPLLADKPEHRIQRRAADRLPPDNPWGFRMEVPELLYDRGELHNLSVARGTLTNEDRYKINEHIVQTVRMLCTLPFPKHLRQVPEIAGGHHEKMDGTGYPKRLAREQMSPVARMMAIADVFEALTAVDRPYKKGKTLSQALNIMVHMRREAHIDPDLFELFLRSGVYLDYAQRFLKPEQIDEVDPQAILKAV